MFCLSFETGLFCCQVMAEVCHNGYKDALMFLKENGGQDFTWSLKASLDIRTSVLAVWSMFCVKWKTTICLISDLIEQASFVTELITNHRQDKRLRVNTHDYTWQDDDYECRKSRSGQRCALDRQEINLLPESVQKGTSVSQSFLLRRMWNHPFSLLGKIWFVSVPQSFVKLVRRNADAWVNSCWWYVSCPWKSSASCFWGKATILQSSWTWISYHTYIELSVMFLDCFLLTGKNDWEFWKDI